MKFFSLLILERNLLGAPVKATSRFCVKGMHMNVRAGEWALKGRRLLCVDVSVRWPFWLIEFCLLCFFALSLRSFLFLTLFSGFVKTFESCYQKEK